MMNDRSCSLNVNNVPVGFRFRPTDEEVIRGLLLPKVIGFPVPRSAPVLDKDVYTDAPWNVCSDVDDSSPYWNEDGTKKTIYVFTNLTKKSKKTSKSTKNTSRTAGCGTWSGQTGGKPIMDSRTGHIVGETRMLSFATSSTDSDHHWTMHEYGLSGDLLEGIGKTSNATVLCRITKKQIKNIQPQISFPAPETIGATGDQV